MRTTEMLDTQDCCQQCCRGGAFFRRACLLLFSVCIACLNVRTCPAESEPEPCHPLCGVVIDKQDGSPLAGACVHIVGDQEPIYTDTNGEFEFPSVTEGQHTLQFTKIDYQPFEAVVLLDASTTDLQIELKAVRHQMKAIEVTGETGDLAQFEKTTDLAVEDVKLQKQLGMTLADTLSEESGISQRTMGRSAARPVIRGLGGDRLLILEDGERTGDKSASSADHAVAVDPTTADGVEITRGARALIYGSSTLGGVINVKRNTIPQVLPQAPDIQLTLQGESVNLGRTATTGIVVPLGPFAAQLKWNRRIAAETRTPLGTLANTELSNLNFSTGASFVKDWGYIGLSGGSYGSDYGIPGSPEGHIHGVDIELQRYRYEGAAEYRFNRPDLQKIKLQGTATSYQHQELESNGMLGVEFGVLTYNFSAMAHLFNNAVLGMWGEYRDHATGGFYWTPHTQEFALAGFLLSEKNFERLTLQGALRYDVRRAEPFRDTGFVIRAGTVQRRDFGGVSGAASGIYHWTDTLSIGTNLMKTFRAPGIEELFSDGPHLAVYAYEIGNAELGPEHGYGTEVFGRYATNRFNLTFTVFGNQIDGYLTPTNTGEKEWGSGSAGWLWIYQYTGQDVLMSGIETQIEGEVLPDLTLQLNLSYVHGTNQDTGEPLERIPPLNGKFGIRYTPDPFHFHATSRFAGSQNRLGEFEEPTESYLVYDIGAYLRTSWWELENMIVIEVENVLDTVYREHLSRIKNVMPEPGRNVKMLYKLLF